ncbi:putative aerotaxis sensory transducer [Photobacterium leiognathi lrivu.4.1]|uniref:Putative aerotaxis sensory transducer n=2 Tax=Photobacterium TaxID=657 RepID=V5H6H4_PHOLE|nr:MULTISPECIES: methyl-accepting chemotaxis protein [Photobacterium]EAS63340.1 putative aerotaxis sensory transducer [Vibrio angustum S14] [Photobacterium angustum S14]GAD32577.1 putative aerotaxis sensory transducer [Photobacterium leiognathi lrivu.4.1]
MSSINTGNEVEIHPDAQIVSTTDLSGKITYVNDTFCEISGYSRNELIGKTHNILKHPDMPEEVFGDLWKTIKQNKCWRGAVKNRCKNGDFYWVDAFITPLYDNDKVNGYQSVRLSLSNQHKIQAQNVYSKIKYGKKLQTSTSPITKQVLFFLISAISILLTLLISPYFSFLLPALILMLFKKELINAPAWQRKLKEKYNSISIHIFNHDIKNHAEFVIGLKDAQMKAILARTYEASTNVNIEINTVATLSETCKKKIDQENSHLDSISTAIEEMSSSITHVAENCQNTLSTVTNAEYACHHSSELINLTSQNISHLTNEINETSNITEALASEAKLITGILQEIESISEQTNLLALNAAIEAARAGEHGRGFSVVADEVRALSRRTNNATSQIQKSVNYILSSLTNVAERMKVGSDESQKCVSDVKGVSKKIDKILSLINQISHLSHQISTAAEQQAMVAKEININSYQILDASKVNLREINTITETISEMTQNSAQLVDLSKAFK